MKIFKTNEIETIKYDCENPINKPVSFEDKKHSPNNSKSSFFLETPGGLESQMYLILVETCLIPIFFLFSSLTLDEVKTFFFSNWLNFIYVIPLIVALIFINYLIICAINYRLVGSSERPTR